MIALLVATVVLQSPTWGEPTLLCKISDRRIDESSGIAASRIASGVYYTHNDSGDQPRFFKFNSKGVLLGWYRLKNAQAIDWEDMASAKIEGQPRLYLADIGDNAAKRPSVQVYVVNEPTVRNFAEVESRRYDLTYPDHPHDAEAFFVHPKTGDFTIVTKERQGDTQVYTLSFKPSPGSYTLKHVGTLSFPNTGRGTNLVTGGDISPDGSRVVLRTYTAAYEFDASDPNVPWWKQQPTVIKTAAEIQGEAIAYSIDGRALVTTSEFAPCPVSVIRLE